MLYVREFEITEPDSNGLMAVIPFGLDGATQGAGFDEAIEMAADWLYHTVQYALINGEDLPETSFGNAPKHGGRIVVVGVDVDAMDTNDHESLTETIRIHENPHLYDKVIRGIEQLHSGKGLEKDLIDT